MSRTKWQALLRTAKPVGARAAFQFPAVGQVAVATTQPGTISGWQPSADFLQKAVEGAFIALQDADPDPIANAERRAIQGDAEPHYQTIPQHTMLAGLLAGAGKPRRGAQAEVQTDTKAQPLFCFPCGAMVPDGNRKWSATRGWCCRACVGDAA